MLSEVPLHNSQKNLKLSYCEGSQLTGRTRTKFVVGEKCMGGGWDKNNNKKYYRKKILRGPRIASVACHHSLWMMQVNNLTSDDLWTWYLTFDCMNIWRFPYYINKPSLVQIGLQLFKWDHFHIFSLLYNLTSDDLWPCYMTFDCTNIWRFPYYINKPSLVQIGLQLFKWDHFHIFSLPYNLTLDDLWPRYMTFDLINKLRFSCCIYDPTLVEIHQPMWKLEPNVNLFSQQQTTKVVDKVIPMCLSC